MGHTNIRTIMRDMVKRLDVYKNNQKGTYRGISREFYPKSVLWKMLEDGATEAELEEVVEDFYITYYYYNLKLDQLDNEAMAFVLFNFATLHGKRKALQKLSMVTGVDVGMVSKLNSMGTLGVYKLLIELLDFYNYTKSYAFGYVLDCYRSLP